MIDAGTYLSIWIIEITIYKPVSTYSTSSFHIDSADEGLLHLLMLTGDHGRGSLSCELVVRLGL